MKVLIDINIILDVLCNRTGFVDDSLKVVKYCEANQIAGLFLCCPFQTSYISCVRNLTAITSKRY